MLFSVAVAIICATRAVYALGQEPVISFHREAGSVQLAGHGTSHGAILLDSDDWPGVLRAANDLATDLKLVTGTHFAREMSNETVPETEPNRLRDRATIIAGTIGKSKLVDSLIQRGKIDVTSTEGKWEAFQTEVVREPIEGISNALVISGSDKRGVIYGIYDIPEQIGVSPWYWFADVPPAKHTEVNALKKRKVQGPPSVKYRGMFINDEQPAMTNWINANYPPAKYGPGFNADFYSRIFELLLRLRANYLWPAEWDSIFALDDPRNSLTADEYGIAIGTQKPPSSPRLEYDMYVFLNVSEANATVYLGPSLNTDPSRPLKYAIAFNDAEPQVVQFVPSTPLGSLPSNWGASVSNGVWTNTTSHSIDGGGNRNILKLWAIEPGVVFQKVVVDLGGVRQSYLGPPESKIV